MQLNVSTIRGKKVAASASLRYDLGDTKGFFPKVDNPSYYRTPIDTEPLGYLRSEKELSHEMAFAFGEQGLNLYRLYITTDENKGRALWIKMINNLYREERDVKQRIKSVLSALAPSNIDTITVVVEADGIPTHEYRFRTIDLLSFREGR